MRKATTHSEDERCRTAHQKLGPNSTLAAARGHAENGFHAAAALHCEQAGKAERAGQPGQQCVLHIRLACETEQFPVTALVHEPCIWVLFQIVVDVLVDNPTVDTVLLLQRAERE